MIINVIAQCTGIIKEYLLYLYFSKAFNRFGDVLQGFNEYEITLVRPLRTDYARFGTFDGHLMTFEDFHKQGSRKRIS